ncbi:MAG: SH3 domain-containing protein [Leptospirales bacterium]|nr:SH3 domain-containing protein [Leptospirales bacterium]
MKKIILTNIISLILFCLVLSVLPTHSATSAETGEKYVAAKSGLNLRSEPGKSSKVITLIPFGSRVVIEKSDGDEIFLDGRYGKWVNVKFGSRTGWVFSGFLCDFEPATIIKPAADYFKEPCRKDEWCVESKEYKNFKDSDITIVNIIDNYIVLKIPHVDYDGSRSINVVWRYDLKQKKFLAELSGGYIVFLYLDNDKYPDFVAVNEGHGGESMQIFLGSENELIRIYNSRDYYAGYFLYDMSIGPCGGTKFACRNWPENEETNNKTVKYFRFNCDKRKIEEYAESVINWSEGIITSIDWKNMSIVIKDKKSLRDTSYKFSDTYKSDNIFYYAEYIERLKKKLQKNKGARFFYVTIKNQRIIYDIDLEDK